MNKAGCQQLPVHEVQHILDIAGDRQMDMVIQGAAERTPQFGRGIASGGEHVQWWGARRQTAVYVPFCVHHGVVGRTSSLYCSGVYKKW